MPWGSFLYVHMRFLTARYVGRYTENWNLWDATHRLVADVDTVIHDAESGVMQDPHKHTEWRFVMDNSVTVVAPALEELSQLMEDDVFFRDKQCAYNPVAVLHPCACLTPHVGVCMTYR